MSTAESITSTVRSGARRLVSGLTERIGEPPSPVLALIGAADMAAEQIGQWADAAGRKLSDVLPDLEEVDMACVDRSARDMAAKATDRVKDAFEDLDEVPAKVRDLAAELPGKAAELGRELPDKAQSLVGELGDKAQQLADQVEQLATKLPGYLADLREQLPEQLAQARSALHPSAIKETATAYAGLLGTIVQALGERGKEAVKDVDTSAPAENEVAPEPAGPGSAAKKPAARKPAVKKTPAPKTTATKSAARRAATPAVGIEQPIAVPPKTTPARKPRAPRVAASKPVSKPAAATKAEDKADS